MGDDSNRRKTRAFIRRRYVKDQVRGRRRQTGFEVEWRNEAGERRRKLHKTHADAAAHRDQLNAPGSADKSPAPIGTITVEQAGMNWIQRVKGDGRARGTWRKYEQRQERHIVPMMVARADGDEPRRFGDFTLAEVDTPLCMRFKAALQKAGRSPAMVQKIMADLRMQLTSAQLAGEIDRNAATPVRAKRGERHKPPVEIPTPEQVRAILNAVNANDSDVTLGRVWLNMLPMTGARPEETRGLGWNYILFGASPPVVRVAMAADEKGIIGPPKSKAGYRDIPLPPGLLGAAEALEAEMPEVERPR
jgi:integrase